MNNSEVVRGDNNPDIVFLNVPHRDYEKQPKEDGERELTAYGLLSVATFVREKSNKKVGVIDAENLGLSHQGIRDLVKLPYNDSIRQNRIFRIGLNVLTPNFNETMVLGEFLGKEFPLAEQIYGGSHTYLDPESILERRPNANVIMGEGEESVSRLVNGEDKNNIQGLLFKSRDGKVQWGMGEKKPSVVYDLDSLPWIDRSLAANEPYMKYGKKTMSFMGSRGCVGNCGFCIAPVQFEVLNQVGIKKIRCRNINNLMEEIDSRRSEYSLEMAQFLDDDIFFNNTRAINFLNKWKDHNLDKLMEFTCLLRPDQIVSLQNNGILKYLSESGLKSISFGIETGHDYGRSLISNGNNIDLKYNPEIQKKAVEYCSKIGIETKGFMMIGLIGETEEQVQQTFDYGLELKKIGLNRISVFPLKIYPGTDLWMKAINAGFTKEQLGHYRSPNTRELIQGGCNTIDASRDTFVQEVKLSEVEPKKLIFLANDYMKLFNSY